MPSKCVILVVASFLLVVLIFSLYSIPEVFAKPPQKGPITCRLWAGGVGKLCCQTTTDGAIQTFCTLCDNTSPPSNCGPRFDQSLFYRGSVNTTGVLAPLGPNAPPNTGTPPPVSIIKVPPGTVNPAGNTMNPSNNTANSTAMKAGAYSPTGFCVRIDRTSCIPCDSGLPGGRDTCIPSSDWPGPATLKGKIGQGVGTPLGNATNAPPTGSNTGTPPPPPSKALAGPGCGPGTDNSTCSTSTPNPQSTPTPTPTPGSNLGSSTSNGNSTGH